MARVVSLFTEEDVQTLLNGPLLGPLANYAAGLNLPVEEYLRMLRAAERETARALRVDLTPTTIFPNGPSEAQLEALDGAAWDEEPGYDYEPAYFSGDRFGFFTLRRKPVLEVVAIRYAYPSPGSDLFDVPKDWIRVDKKYGHVNLIPSSTPSAAPLAGYIAQALGGGSRIPLMLQVTYRTGLEGVAGDDPDPEWADVLDVIYKKAAGKVIEGFYLPASGSISGDGLSQSISFDGSKHRDLINESLFGPKGSNGGLFTAIHGMPGLVAGPA